ncbi:N amino acid transport system protein [Fusarium oxysporum f. sp. albedinis]|nr:N amino acid transport system protein [Fusarium oxysporum f. sp. albedinis]
MAGIRMFFADSAFPRHVGQYRQSCQGSWRQRRTCVQQYRKISKKSDDRESVNDSRHASSIRSSQTL